MQFIATVARRGSKSDVGCVQKESRLEVGSLWVMRPLRLHLEALRSATQLT
jgi:hypothetical protein